MKLRLTLAFLFVMSVFSLWEVQAQDQILVRGRVISTVDDEPLSGVRIYVFKTVGAGQAEYQRALTTYETFYQPEGAFVDYRTMPDGTFEFFAQPSGSIIFYHFPFKPVFEKIRSREKIPTIKIEATTVLDASNLVEEGKKKTKKGKPVALGNKFSKTEYYYFDQARMGEVDGVGKDNARMIAQMYLTNSDGSDTLRYFTPRVYAGEQFHKTQYHWRNDYLYQIAEKNPRLHHHIDSLQLPVSFEVDDPTALYFCKANIWIEDYNHVYYMDTITVFNTGRVSRPFQFLDYSFDQCKVDPQRYYKPPRLENVSAQKDMKLQFLVGQAELDRSDHATMAALDSLKAELKGICDDFPSSRLNELHFEGMSSPDGRYAKNKTLSGQRTNTVFNEVWKVIPHKFRDMIFKTVKGKVASWDEVADLVEANSHKEEAEAIRKITARTKDMDEQGDKIRKLPFYTSRIKPVLPQLRSVKCYHQSQVYRFLTPEEILERYNTDEGYRNGTKILNLNEYWHLFNMVKGDKELENLYERARFAAIRAEGRKNPWALPANHLAVMYLKRKQVDTTLLRPFIDEGFGANFSLMQEDGSRKMYNDDAIVANQVQMFMLAGNYSRAEELSSIIENEHPVLRAIVRCLGGFIDYEDPKEEKTIELIQKSSPRNEVVINLYRSKFDSTAIKAFHKLPQEEPLTDYLKTQRLCIQYDNDIMKMKATDFDRNEDPWFSHPKDEIIPAATPEDIQATRDAVTALKEEIDLYASMGLDVESMKKELETQQATLANMEKGETSIIPASCSVYEAAYIYLKKCFEKDKKYVRTAQADYDIAEELLNDVLGIKKKK